MAGTIIDSLIVQLGLDPKKFGSGVDAAHARLDKFKKLVAALGIDESKLDEKQKLAFNSLKKIATQSQATRKELSASAKAGEDFWGVLKTGALGFGAALSIMGLKQFVTDTNSGIAATGRLAKNLGTSTDVVTKWGRAVEASVGGSADAATGSLKNFHDNLLRLKSGLDPSLMQFFGMVSRYSGMSIKTAGEDEQSILLQLGDAAKKMGPERASMVFSQAGFDQDTINFLELGRAGMQAALDKQNKIGAPTDADAKQAQELQKSTADLTQAFDQLKNEVVIGITPTLVWMINSIKNLLDISTGKLDEDKTKTDYTEDEARGRAERLAADRLSGKRSKQGFWESLKNGSKDSDAADKEADRLTELMMHGLTTEQAAAQLDKEEAGAPKMTFPAGGNRLTADQADAQLDKEEAGAPKMTFPAGGKRFGSYGPQQLPAGLLDAIPGLERSGDNATSPKGAQGRYQLMPATAAHYGVDANDPDAAKGAASKLLLELYTHFNGDVYKTLAGYNWGQTKLDQDIAAHGDAWRDYLPKETADYIGRYQGDTHSVQIGDIHVHTTATNGKQIAQDIRTDIRNRGLVTQSTSAIN